MHSWLNSAKLVEIGYELVEISSNIKFPVFLWSTLLNVQVKWSNNAQAQVPSESSATPLGPTADQYTGYTAPQQPSTGNDVTGSLQRQPEVRQVLTGEADTVL